MIARKSGRRMVLRKRFDAKHQKRKQKKLAAGRAFSEKRVLREKFQISLKSRAQNHFLAVALAAVGADAGVKAVADLVDRHDFMNALRSSPFLPVASLLH